MATTDEKKIIEIVVKTTGAADIKKLASELAAMRKEAKTTRTEIQQTNSTLNGFGSTFKTVAKAFAGGLALKNLVQSSEVMQDLTQNVRDLAGSFIDAAAEAAGFTETMDDDFWMTATQGAKDLGRAVGNLWTDAKAMSQDSSILKGLDQWFRKWTSIGRQIEWVNQKWKEYRDNAKFDAPTLGGGAMTEMLGDVSRLSGGASDLQKKLDADTKAIGAALRNRRELADRLFEQSQQMASDARWRQSFMDRDRPDFREQNMRGFAMDADESVKNFRVDLEGVVETTIKLTEESRNFINLWDTLETTTYTWNQGLKNAIDYMHQLNELQGDLTNQSIAWGEALTYSFKGVLTGELHNTRDVLRQITNEMRSFYAELAARAAAEQTLKWVQMAIGAFGASTSGASVGRYAGMVSANGNAFDRGNVIPMARGGVVTGPTLFPMANGIGLMGEAGPEAVMPLKRGSDGRLGVSAGASNITIVNNTGVAAEAQVSRSSDRLEITLTAARMGANMALAEMNRSISSGYGSTATSLSRAYGLRRRV